jgi:isopropylmalate/homocitrate/citramalate synthase
MIQPKENWHELFVDPRHYTQRTQPIDPALIRIYDTTLRDGEQMPRVAMSPEQKYVIARELSAIGCHIIDMGFPAVSATEREALQLVLRGKHKGEIREDMEILVMCRATPGDIDITIETIAELGFDASEVTFLIFTSASNLHCKYKLGPMLMERQGKDSAALAETGLEFFHEANKAMVADAILYARSRGITSIEFGTEDASRTPVDQLIDLVRVAVRAGAKRYIFPDTTGSLTPESTKLYCQALTQSFPEIDRVSHFHNDFDLATINSITGVLNGFYIVSTSVNGIGERAGNTPLHSVLAGLKYLYGLEIPNFHYDRLCHIKRVVEEITGIPVSALEPVVGHNVYSHESGIHTHGVSICRRMYEPIPFEEVGGAARFVYGKHSGSNAVANLLSQHSASFDREVSRELVLSVLAEIKRMREARTYSEDTRESIRNYYSKLNALGVAEADVVAIAKILARRQEIHQVPDAELAAMAMKQIANG